MAPKKLHQRRLTEKGTRLKTNFNVECVGPFAPVIGLNSLFVKDRMLQKMLRQRVHEAQVQKQMNLNWDLAWMMRT